MTIGYEFGPFYLDTRGRVLLRDREVMPVRPKVIDILIYLIENKDEVVTRESILRHVWAGTLVEEGNLSNCIWSLRRTLTRDGYKDPIKTIPHRGYRFSAEVQTHRREYSDVVPKAGAKG
jgi:DNA-binding winged helix-turn-helix (wHTH) protein